jgi:nitroreductase
MFAMTLLYAFHAQGIASCCLNTSTSFFQDIALRRVCKIPGWETPIMMIVIGYPPKSLQVATAARVPTEALLSFQDLNAEEGSQ